ncbi:MAG: RNA polymerase sigma factor [Polyangiaceae bacterium]
MPIHELIERLFRAESGKIRATLIRTLRDFDAAEEVVQEAFEAALVQWPSEGIPDHPAAWLTRIAKNRAIDRVRRSVDFEQKRSAEALMIVGHVEPEEERAIEDDVLRLIFTCCHPALAPEAQVALTLQTVCGLRTEAIARAFLVPHVTMSQRLVRAKKKIREAGIPYDVPPASLMRERLESVSRVVYLVFTEGYASTDGDQLVQADLCDEALRLSSLLRAHVKNEPELDGLHALMLLHDARRATRIDADGALVLLEDQDRTLWDWRKIVEGCRLVHAAIHDSRAGVYVLQATIAALHAAAPVAAMTDWQQIERLYATLIEMAPSPIVALNHAVAVAMSQGPEKGLEQIDRISQTGALEQYHLMHAARADLLRRLQRNHEARTAYERALSLAAHPTERLFLERRLNELKP